MALANNPSHTSDATADAGLRRRRTAASENNPLDRRPSLLAEKPASSPESLSDGAVKRSVSLPIFNARYTAGFCLILYLSLVLVLTMSARAQTFLIYLHWIKPPTRLFPLTNLQHHRLSTMGRNVRLHNLRGWHVLPPGPPFPSEAFSSADFDARLAAPNQRAILFFHGNAGTRAFPSKRVNLIKLLNAQFDAHVITFDYSGFGDSGGHPSERTFHADARLMVDWVCKRMHNSSSIFLYGQSLGSFASTYAAAFASGAGRHRGHADVEMDDAEQGRNEEHRQDDDDDNNNEEEEEEEEDVRLLQTMREWRDLSGMILDAPPASLQSAAKTHPITKTFRATGLMGVLRRVLQESHDSTRTIRNVRMPILILHGRRDLMIPPWQGRLLAEQARKNGNTQVNFVEFGEAGHVDVSGADGFLRIVNDFVEKCEADGRTGLTNAKQ